MAPGPLSGARQDGTGAAAAATITVAQRTEISKSIPAGTRAQVAGSCREPSRAGDVVASGGGERGSRPPRPVLLPHQSLSQRCVSVWVPALPWCEPRPNGARTLLAQPSRRRLLLLLLDCAAIARPENRQWRLAVKCVAAAMPNA